MWWRSLIGLFLVLHGLVFAFLDPDSWLVDDGRGLYLALGIVAAAALALGAVLLVARSDSWRVVTAVGAGVSLVQLLVFFEPGLVVGVGIDVAILAAVGWTLAGRAAEPTLKGVTQA